MLRLPAIRTCENSAAHPVPGTAMRGAPQKREKAWRPRRARGCSRRRNVGPRRPEFVAGRKAQPRALHRAARKAQPPRCAARHADRTERGATSANGKRRTAPALFGRNFGLLGVDTHCFPAACPMYTLAREKPAQPGEQSQHQATVYNAARSALQREKVPQRTRGRSSIDPCTLQRDRF